MLDAKVKELINAQINEEFFSAYLYLSFANYFYDNGLDGFANWYDIQAQEEHDHAMLMRTYLHNNGERVIFEALNSRRMTLQDAEAVLKEGWLMNSNVTSLINKIYHAADSSMITAPCSASTGSSKNRAKKKRMPTTCLKNMNCSAKTLRASIPSTRNYCSYLCSSDLGFIR